MLGVLRPASWRGARHTQNLPLRHFCGAEVLGDLARDSLMSLGKQGSGSAPTGQWVRGAEQLQAGDKPGVMESLQSVG